MACPAVLLVALGALAIAAAPEPCRIDGVEPGSGWPVPMVELRTPRQERWHADKRGIVACDDPDLMGHEAWLGVTGHGYEVPRDGHGNRGVRIRPVPGGRHRIGPRRTQVARRLGRLTGSGLFAETRKLGMRAPSWAATASAPPCIAAGYMGFGATPPWPDSRWASPTARARRPALHSFNHPSPRHPATHVVEA